MNADGQLVVVHVPKMLENVLGEEARVGEDQRGAILPQKLVELGNSPCRRMPAPGHPVLFRQQDLDLGRRPRLALHHRHPVDLTPRGNPCPEAFFVGYRGGQRGALHIGRDGLQPRKAQGQQIAPLAGGESVNLVDDDAPAAGKEIEALRVGEQQREAFRRSQQYVWRLVALAALPVRRGIAAARLGADR